MQKDSALVTFVREGERVLEGVRRNKVARHGVGIALLALAALLFIPSWFLVPGLMLAGFSLLGWRPFRCGAAKRRSVRDELL